MLKVIVTVFLLVISAEVYGEQAFFSEKGVQCYQKECPSETTGCKKVMTTTKDKKFLTTTISCLDAQDLVLKDHIQEQENPFGPSTYFHSSSFSGTYVSGTHSPQPISINVNNNRIHNPDGIEDNIEDLS